MRKSKWTALIAIFILIAMITGCVPPSENSDQSSDLESSNAESEEISKEESKTSEDEKVGLDNYVDNIKLHPTTIVKKDDNTYSITTELFDGIYTRTFVKRTWGTWNMGAMSFKPQGGSDISFVAASTDWEYVFRAGKTAGTIAFCGGNHGNEKMIDIAFFDGESGEELDLEDKKAVTVNLLKIVENTEIYYHEQPDDVFAKVERIYYYSGKTLFNECNYEITNDTFFSLSYTAMMPINKDYGTNIIYYLEDGTEREWMSSKVGKADYSGPSDKDNAALAVEIFGHKDPRYRFNVEVYTKEDSTGNFSNDSKTFFWDMNTNQNKLYFSRFPDASSTLVKEDAKWRTLTSWEFNFKEDASE